MGGRRLVTSTLATESGASLRGAGFRCIGQTKPHNNGWKSHNNGWQSHKDGLNREWQPIYGQLKFRWEKTA
jgi:hypothetical protein